MSPAVYLFWLAGGVNRIACALEQRGVMTTSAERRSDRELLDAVARLDRGALEALHDRHAPWLGARLVRRCADVEVTEEVLQDVFVAIWRKPDAYQGTGDVAAWIWGIAIRRLLQRLRPRKSLLERLVSVRPRAGESAEELVLTRVEHGDLAGALNGLAPDLRAVVQATILDGLTTREAARLLGIPEGTVKTRMARARSQMRASIVLTTEVAP
jgi:RNA polymerase sigma-70 factor (ECF subfamily)